jgi:hypothetical protein
LLTAIAIAGCTNSTEPAATSPTSSPTSGDSAAGEPSQDVDPSSSVGQGGSDSALTEAEAQAALDEALAAVDREGSIGFTSRGENVINDQVTTISGSGAWTRKPLAWTTTTTIDRPKVIINSVSVDVGIIDQIYVESTPSGPYVRITNPDLKKAGLVDPTWMKGIPAYGVGDGVTKKDITTPPDLRMLFQTEASAGSALADTLTITGTIPSSSALDVLDLTGHLGGLGFANRFDDSTTRVLLTIGADGLPQTLEFAGTNISLPGVGLPDYVAEELAVARYFVEYGEANLDGPIKAPAKAAN